VINELTVGPSDCQPRKPGSEAWKADPLEACWDFTPLWAPSSVAFASRQEGRPTVERPVGPH